MDIWEYIIGHPKKDSFQITLNLKFLSVALHPRNLIL
jgi:hypothetical protein